MASKDKPITAYKAFDKNFQCRGYQYEVGKTYEHAGEIGICSAGFHSCENPFDILNYYPITGSRFAKVTASGAVERHDDDSKICSAKLAVEIELTLPEFINSAVAWIIDATKHKSGSGNYAKIGSSGDDAKIGSSGDDAKIGSSGNYAKIGSSGDDAKIGSSGYSAQIGSSGDSAKIGSSGDSAQIGSSGDAAQIGSSGDDAKIGSSGNYAKIGSSGDDAKIGSSGDSAQIGSSGDDAKIGSSGNYAKIDITGKDAVVATAGRATRVKAEFGTWVSVAEFDGDGKCVGFATGQVGHDEIPPDTWLVARGGKLVVDA